MDIDGIMMMMLLLIPPYHYYSFLAIRDHMGITPLYIGYGADGSVWFASEMKALVECVARVQSFPPGHMYDSKAANGKGALVQWYNPIWFNPEYFPTEPADLTKIRNAFEEVS